MPTVLPSDETNGPLKAIEKQLREHDIGMKELRELCRMNKVKLVDARRKKKPATELKAQLLTKLSTAAEEKIAAAQAFLDGLKARTPSSNKERPEAPEQSAAAGPAAGPSRRSGTVRDPLTTASGFTSKAPPARAKSIVAVEEPLLDEQSQDLGPGHGTVEASADEDPVELSQAQSLAHRAAGRASPAFSRSSQGTQEDGPGPSAAASDDIDRRFSMSPSDYAVYGSLQWRIRQGAFHPREKTIRKFDTDRYGRVWWAWEVVPEMARNGYSLGSDGVMTSDGQSLDGRGMFRYVIGLCDPKHVHPDDEDAVYRMHPPPQRDPAEVEAERRAAREAERRACIADGVEKVKQFLATRGITLGEDEMEPLRTWLEGIWDHHCEVSTLAQGPSAASEETAPRRSARLQKRKREEQGGGGVQTIARGDDDEGPAAKKQRQNPRRTTRARK